MQATTKPSRMRKWWIALGIILGLLVVAEIMAFFLGADTEFANGNVALISLHGPISVSGAGGFGQTAISSTKIVKLINKAAENPKIEAIVLEINSPGGSAVASDEIATAIEKSNKTTVAWIREVGASGGYWIAASADHIVANRMSITGSIGVIGSYLEIPGLLERWNITYRGMTAGEHKDMGSPFKEMTEEEQALFQSTLDSLHHEFIQHVADSRELSYTAVEPIATGRIILGSEAHNLGLVDELGSKEQVKTYLEKTLETEVDFVKYEPDKSFFEELAGLMNTLGFSVGQGLQQPLIAEQGIRLQSTI